MVRQDADRHSLSYKPAAKYRDDVARLRKAIQSNPFSWPSYFQLGTIFQDNRANREAIACFEKVLSLNKEHADSLFRLGLAYQDIEKPESAVKAYLAALQANPSLDAVYANLGTVYQAMGRHQKAIECYEKALLRFPDHPVVHLNMGTAYSILEQTDKAIACYERAVRCKPDYEKAVCYLFKQYQRHCDWEKSEALADRLDALTQKAFEKGEIPAETPFVNISRHADSALNHAVSLAWSRGVEARRMSDPRRYSHGADDVRSSGTIRIGYLSNTFCNHPGAQLILQLFGLHDRTRFEVYAYSYGVNDGSTYRKKIEADADCFKDIKKISDGDAAELIHGDRIDILVDLRGYTRDGRLGICAYRPAPVQLTYLGYPGTTGASFIDYLITDRIITPLDHHDWYSEALVFLPHCYQINDNRQHFAQKAFRREEMGLPEKGTVFCSFNTHYKIDRIMFEAWMTILHRVPGSVLWLLDGSSRMRLNLCGHARRCGIDPDRLVFAKKLPKDEHLARLEMADLGLDTRVYGGHTTTTDALWAGLPVVALTGNHFASRVSTSILTAAGMSALVTDSLDAYVNLAVELGHDQCRLETLRLQILDNHSIAPLFDTVKMVRHIETAYERMWHRYRNGRSPETFFVTDPSDTAHDSVE